MNQGVSSAEPLFCADRIGLHHSNDGPSKLDACGGAALTGTHSLFTHTAALCIVCEPSPAPI